MFKNLTVSRKIAIGFGFGIAALIFMSLTAYITISNIHEADKKNIQARDYRRTFEAAKGHHLIWLSKVSAAILDTKAKEVNAEFDPHKCEFGKWYYGEKRRDAERFAPQITEHLQKLEAPHNKTHETGNVISDLLAKGDRTAATTLYLSTLLPLCEEINNVLDSLYVDVMKNVPGDKELSTLADRSRLIIGVIGFFFSLVILIFAFFLGKNITSMLNETINALSSTSTEIASTINQHERTANQQAAMVNETTVTVDELRASARQTSEQAASTAAVAQKALALTEEGSTAVKETVNTMNNLKEKIGGVAEQILRLGEQTAQVGNIANLVRDIASQTNMLALNAAVEAARAGEHGKGFAVVAGEVRKLADQSKKSAEQANIIIADIQKATNSTIMVTEEGTKTAEDVTRLAGNLGELFGSLANAANSVYENAQQVLLNTKQQSAALNQVIGAVNSINTGAKETAAGITQTKIGIQKLDEAAQNLKGMV